MYMAQKGAREIEERKLIFGIAHKNTLVNARRGEASNRNAGVFSPPVDWLWVLERHHSMCMLAGNASQTRTSNLK